MGQVQNMYLSNKKYIYMNKFNKKLYNISANINLQNFMLI